MNIITRPFYHTVFSLLLVFLCLLFTGWIDQIGETCDEANTQHISEKKIGIVETKIYSIQNVLVIVLQELAENTCIINRCKETKQARKIDIYFKSPAFFFNKQNHQT